MLTFEFSAFDADLISEVKSLFKDDYTELEINSLDSSEVIQIIIPLAVVLAPAISEIVKKILDNERISIKHGAIEISARGNKNAMQIYKQIIELSKEADDEE